jgi:hypothetical protein
MATSRPGRDKFRRGYIRKETGLKTRHYNCGDERFIADKFTVIAQRSKSAARSGCATGNYWTTEVMAKELGPVPAASVPTGVRAPVAASTV